MSLWQVGGMNRPVLTDTGIFFVKIVVLLAIGSACLLLTEMYLTN